MSGEVEREVAQMCNSSSVQVCLCAPVCLCVSVCSCVQVCLRRLTPLPRLMSTSAKECAATEGGQILVLQCNEGDFWMDHLPRLLGLLG